LTRRYQEGLEYGLVGSCVSGFRAGAQHAKLEGRTRSMPAPRELRTRDRLLRGSEAVQAGPAAHGLDGGGSPELREECREGTIDDRDERLERPAGRVRTWKRSSGAPSRRAPIGLHGVSLAKGLGFAARSLWPALSLTGRVS